ncbi:MAG TPA: hypothetical protein VMU90_11850 [Solirubrobacteraceae bacterium]|nr:hypothetical protein [Solirubrobacteraceae bacterium]
MSARTLAAPSAEIRRLRAERDGLRRMLADLVGALPDPADEVRYRQVLCLTAAAAVRDRAWSEGFAAALADVKAAQHGIVRDVRQHLRTWDGIREEFGRPRPGDYTGAPARAGSDEVWLAGPVVHHHQCLPACYAYRPGWYTRAEAAAILAALPGDYAGAA